MFSRLQNSRFWKARSAVSVIREWKRASLTILPRRFTHKKKTLAPDLSFEYGRTVARVRKKIRLFCSLCFLVHHKVHLLSVLITGMYIDIVRLEPTNTDAKQFSFPATAAEICTSSRA